MIEEVTPELKRRVREIVEDRESGGIQWFERRKGDYMRFGKKVRPSALLAAEALAALRTKDQDEDLRDENVSQAVYDQLAPTVEEAMEGFRKRRPDLDPESPQNW